MNNPPNPDHESEQNSSNNPRSESNQRTRWRRRILLGVGSAALIGVGGTIAFAWYWLETRLVPLVEKELALTLNRPVDVGPVRGISLGGLRFGKSQIPPTQSDPDKVIAKGVDVLFDPMQLIFDRVLKLDVTLVEPDIYLEQNEKFAWISTEIAERKGKGPIETRLHSINFKDARLELVARSLKGKLKTPVKGFIDTGISRFLNKNKLIEYQLDVQLEKGGVVGVSGEFLPKTKQIKVSLKGEDVAATEVSRLLELPIGLQAGQVETEKLDIDLRGGKIASIDGIATMQDVTARLQALPQPFTKSNGSVYFRGAKVSFDNVTALFDTIPLKVNGIVDTKKEFDLKAKTEPIQIAQVLEAFKLQKPEVPLLGEFQADIAVVDSIKAPKTLIEIVNSESPARIDKINFAAIKASLEQKNTHLYLRNLEAIPTFGGRITGGGQFQLVADRDFQINFRANNIPGKAVTRLYDYELPFDVSSVSGQTQIVGSFKEKPDKYVATGEAILQPAGGGTIKVSDVEVARKRWQGNVELSNFLLANLQDEKTQFAGGSLNGAFQVSGRTDSFKTETIRAAGSANLNIAGGQIDTDNFQLANGNWTGNFNARGIELGNLFPQLASRLPEPLSGNFYLAGNLKDAREGIDLDGSGNVLVAGGTLKVDSLQIAKGRFRGVVSPDRLELARLFPPQPGAEPLAGSVSGRLNLAGNMNNFSASTTTIAGNLNFSEGFSLIDRPLSTKINWNGERLEIEQATARGFDAEGFIDPNLSSSAGAIEQFYFDVRATGLNLEELANFLPKAASRLPVKGQLDFDGTIAGTLKAPKINGDITLRDFDFETLAVEPLLRGNIAFVPGQGLNLQLAGVNDQIRVNLDPKYRPVSFFVQLADAKLAGSRQGERLVVNIETFPVASIRDFASLAGVNLPETIKSQKLSGDLSGTLFVNLDGFEVYGDNVAIANPVFGGLRGDSFTADIQYANKRFVLAEGKFKQGSSEYLLDGIYEASKGAPQYQARLNIDRGRVQDILAALQIFELSDFALGFQGRDYGTAADLYEDPAARPPQPLFSVGSPEASILDRLRRFSEIEALLEIEREQRQEASRIPELRELQGPVDAEIVISGSPTAGLDARFDILGQEWTWGKYAAKRVVAKGSFKDGVLTVMPFEIEGNRGKIAFSGNLGGQTQSGQLTIANFPVEMIQDFVQVPPSIVGLGGRINATTTISGTRDNPKVMGEIEVVEATINQTTIESTKGNFTYDNARLDFALESNIGEAVEPATISGTFPYKLPFASVIPESDRLALNVNVKDKGLTLLNILSRGQVTWVEGEGDVNLDVSGSFDREKGRPSQLVAKGTANVANATIGVQILPDEPLTQVNGQLLFDFDKVRVENFTGKFGGGEVLMSGNLPLSRPIPQTDPLQVVLQDLALSLKGLYKGGVKGKILVTGTALEPDLAGDVELFDGQVLLSSAIGGRGANASATGNGGLAAVTDFNNLNLKLGEDVRVVSPPIFNFLASGDLNVSGTIRQPRPEGTIRLQRGYVNLFTSQLRLAREYEHTARFSANRGLDPYLDVRLSASALEANRFPTAPTYPFDEIGSEVGDVPISSLSTVETVRIQAKVQGYASQITEIIELNSSPPRSETEIVALLGGGFVNTYGRGDSALGVANLAGSAVLGTLQTIVGEALGFGEFRIFPTAVLDEEKRRSTLELAAEISVNLSDRFSLSALKILTTNQLPQFGVLYRINDNLTLRGSSDFSKDTRFVVEYEVRF